MSRMSAELRLQANLESFNKWLWYFAQTCKSSFEKNLAQQAKLLVRDALHYTPPMKKGSSFQEGKRLGETAIDIDTARSFHAVDGRYRLKKDSFFEAYGLPVQELRASVGEHLAWYLTQRGKNKRIKTFLVPKRAIFTNDLKEVRKKLKERVGWLASGWMAAANAFQISVPSWISRHSGQGAGGIKIVKNQWEISITCFNRREFYEAKRLQGYLANAVLNRARTLQRRTLFALAKRLANKKEVFGTFR